MRLSLRYRLMMTLLPLLLLLTGLGAGAVALLYRLSSRVDAILRDNYDSVLYMEHLGEALERIDSSFQFALLGQEKESYAQFEANWKEYLHWEDKEKNNITETGEQELVDKLLILSTKYHKNAITFFNIAVNDPNRKHTYFEPGGLLDQFKELKQVGWQILRLNQESMETASTHARSTARDSLIGFGVGLALAALVAVVLTWRFVWILLGPIQVITESALAIGAGNLDQVVPVLSSDELGRLAEAFNTMARQLRHYRQSSLTLLLRAQQTSKATIDSFPDPVLVVDPEGKVEMANPAAYKLFGLNRADTGIFWSPPAPLQEPLLEALRDQLPYLPADFEHALQLTWEEREQSYLPRILPIRDPYGGTLGAAVLLQDVTRYRLLDQVKSDLVATASHELKTPLTSIRLALHLLLEETVGSLNPKQIELVLDARDNAERLLSMVNNLLDLARFEQHHEHLELANKSPEDLLRTAEESARPRAFDQQVTIAVVVAPSTPRVLVDPSRMGHALDNLVDNALKYTDAGGKITLSAEESGDQVVLSIADSGVGIPPEYLPHIFDKFFRVPGQRTPTGTGLGLAIVHEIVIAHGGTITCESQPYQGTIFRICLPIAHNEGKHGT